MCTVQYRVVGTRLYCILYSIFYILVYYFITVSLITMSICSFVTTRIRGATLDMSIHVTCLASARGDSSLNSSSREKREDPIS